MEKVLFTTKANKKAVLVLCGVIVVVFLFTFLVLNSNAEKQWANARDLGVMWSVSKTDSLKLRHSNALAAANLSETMQTVTAIVGVALTVFCYVSNMGVELVITDKRVYGKAFLGKRVDIPVDSVSSVGKGILNTICVASSSGKIMFTFLQDNETAFEEVNKLLVTRQETVIAEKTDKVVNNIPLSAADEIRKFNQLYQEGIISKEEFDQKKKELLGV